jgi:hypothetical protein
VLACVITYVVAFIALASWMNPRNRGVADCTSGNVCPSACPETLPLCFAITSRFSVKWQSEFLSEDTRSKTREPGVLTVPLFFNPRPNSTVIDDQSSQPAQWPSSWALRRA